MARWPHFEAWKTPGCFFMISVAYTIGWTAISSELSYYSVQFGPQMLLALNAAYFLPSVPVLLCQTLWDQHFDRWAGAAAATATRFLVGLGGSAIICAAYPFYPAQAHVILGVVSLLGVLAGIAFGSSYQLVSRFGNDESVALTTGFVGSGPLVILADLVLRIGPQPSFAQRVALFWFVTAVTCAGLVAGGYLLRKHWDDINKEFEEFEKIEQERVSAAPAIAPSADARNRSREGVFLRRDSMIAAHDGLISRSRSFAPDRHDTPSAQYAAMEGGGRLAAETQPLLPTAAGSLYPATPASPSHGADRNGQHLTTAALVRRVWHPALALFLSASTAVLLFPFFTYVPLHGRMDGLLPQAMFAARVISDIAGRVSPKTAWVQTQPGILATALFRGAATPLFFAYIYGWLPPLDDAVVVAYVAVFWFTSGYCNTCAFLMAPQLVPASAGTRAGALMALVFQTASLAALALAFAVIAWQPPPVNL